MPSHPQTGDPSTWIKYRPALCKGCWAGCCTMPVKVSTEDLYHMGLIKVGEVNGALAPIYERLKKRGLVVSKNERNRSMTLKQQPNGDCLYLDENRLCKIYANRPAVCREFPFNSVRPGFCPGESCTSRYGSKK